MSKNHIVPLTWGGEMPQRREVTQFNGPAVRKLLDVASCISKIMIEHPDTSTDMAWQAALNTARDVLGWEKSRVELSLKVVAHLLKTGQLDRLASAHKVVVYDDGSYLIQKFTGYQVPTRL